MSFPWENARLAEGLGRPVLASAIAGELTILDLLNGVTQMVTLYGYRPDRVRMSRARRDLLFPQLVDVESSVSWEGLVVQTDPSVPDDKVLIVDTLYEAFFPNALMVVDS